MCRTPVGKYHPTEALSIAAFTFRVATIDVIFLPISSKS